jgi:hypothetical protein
MKSSNNLLVAAILSATFCGVASAQAGVPVPDAPKAPKTEAAEATQAAAANAGVSRVVNVSADKTYVNVGEFERVKFVADGKETVIAFYTPGAEQVDVGGKQMTVYVSAMSMYSSPGE